MAILTVLGFEQMASLGTAIALQNVPAGAQRAHISGEAQNVRWRDDGTSPTISVGHQIIPAGTASQPLIYKGDLSAIEFIEEAGGGKINVSYYA